MSHSDSEINKSKARIGKKLHVNFKGTRKYPPGLSRREMAMLKRKYRVLREMELLHAASLNNTEEIKSQLLKGVSPNCSDQHGRSALHIAAAKGYTDIVQILLSHGADPNLNDKLHNTPLHLAACTHNLSIISLLVAAGGDVTKLDVYGKNPLQLAQSKLQLLQRSWREGVIELIQMQSELQLIIDIMISVSQRSSRTNVGELELMKLSLKDTERENVDDKLSRLLTELDGIKISNN